MTSSGMVLAAGKGTRLAPLTEHLPKPAMPLGGYPLAAMALLHMHRAGISEVAINAHHLESRLRASVDPWVAQRLHRMHVRWSPEARLLGTGGGLRRAQERGLIEPPVLVVNSDVLCDADCRELLREHQESGADATLLVVNHPEQERFGVLRADPQGTLTSLAGLWEQEGAPLGASPEGPAGVFTGISVLGPRVFEHLDQAPEVSCLVRQGLVPLVQGGGRVNLVQHGGRWQDLGTPGRFLVGQGMLLSGDWPLPVASGVDPWAALAQGAAFVRSADGRSLGTVDAQIEGSAWIAPGVHLGADVVLGGNVVVGPGVSLGAGTRLDNALVMAGTTLEAGTTLSGVVAGTFGGRLMLVAS